MRKMIFAVSDSFVNGSFAFGKSGGLPWPKNDADMEIFKGYTKNQTIICGGNTLASLPKVVYTSNGRKLGLFTGDNLPEDCCVIGGRIMILKYWMYMDEIVVNLLPGKYHADTLITKDIMEAFDREFSTKIIKQHGDITQTIWSKL